MIIIVRVGSRIEKGPGQIEIENITRNDTVTISCSATNNVGRPDIINFQVEVQCEYYPIVSVASTISLHKSTHEV